MNKATLKPRWSDWEMECIQSAFKEKIQYKIISLALEKTVSAINKKIKHLGLRNPTAKPGRIKGQKSDFNFSEKTPRDIREMTKLMQTFAPTQCYQKAKMALEGKKWGESNELQGKKLERGPCLYNLKSPDADFTQASPHDYILTQPEKANQTRIEKIVGDPFYVPYKHVERWAISEGYRPVEKSLTNAGLNFWKDGRYFSRAQVLMQVNGIRIGKKLKPVFLEEEDGAQLKGTQYDPPQCLREGTRQVI